MSAPSGQGQPATQGQQGQSQRQGQGAAAASSQAFYFPGKYRAPVPTANAEKQGNGPAAAGNAQPPAPGPSQAGSDLWAYRSNTSQPRYMGHSQQQPAPPRRQQAWQDSNTHRAYQHINTHNTYNHNGERGGTNPSSTASYNPSRSRYRGPQEVQRSYQPQPEAPPKVLSSSNRDNTAAQYQSYTPSAQQFVQQGNHNLAHRMQNAMNLHRPGSPTWGKPSQASTGVAPPYMPRPTSPRSWQSGGSENYGGYGGQSAYITKDTEQDLRELLSAIPDDDAAVDIEHQPPEVTITLLPHQLKGVAWMKNREAGSNAGGILADDMGLGKTVQTISLIVANRSEDTKCKTTLIVAPLALIKQWEQEILTKTKKGTLKVLLYHGASRTKDPSRLKSYDVVITTFQVVASECPKQSKTKKDDPDDIPKVIKDAGPLYKVKWFRIVLDEAQTIKNKATKSAIGCSSLNAQRRFCLSGTPIQNNVDELYSLLKFLQFKPFHEHVVFKSQISEPLARGRSKVAMDRLRAILQAVMLRRTKTTLIDGKPVLNLPARNVTLENVQFAKVDLDYYNQLEEKMKKRLKSLQKDGYNKNYTNILCLLLRLRQACNHRALVGAGADKESEIAPGKGNTEDDDVDEMMAMFKTLEVDAANRQCTICFEQLVSVPETQKQCDECMSKFVESEALKMNTVSSAGKKGKNSALVMELTKNWFSSAKIDKTMEILDHLKETDPTSKTIIFSQFTTMLDVVEIPLRKKGYKFCRYDGSMPNPDREKSLEAIREDPNVTVMLISLKCGSLGLNLTVANRVIMLDMWWNPALEDQAIDRVHRIGQTRAVEVTRFAVEGTVEDRILALQMKKRALIEGALGDATFKRSKKMTVDELIGLFG
ncbi:hypothetical protein PhCBS80983_g04170 [Powellomyces hirtus]|uniref:Helicase C-terminal domain-containing protein n=1 Tax=Powellomyces hirtus TaxID=109895 RepID=A0A507DYT6_9FUNG|nr:hypothetical protein PhCBS80983_g04170 [Powellomyces hirtus]